MAEKKRLDEVEKIAKDLQTAVGEVCKVVDAMEVSIGAVENTLAGHAAKFDEIMAKLDRMAGFSPIQQATDSFAMTGGSKSSPEDSATIEGTKPSSDGSAAVYNIPRMDLPSFDGTDPLAWLAQAEQYFLVHKTAAEQKVQLALISMSGNAMFWAQWVLRRAKSISWREFSAELIARFGDSSAINAYEAMHLTRQTGSFEDYLALFEARVAQLPTLPPEQYLGMFLGGLQPSIRDSIPDSELSDVFAAIRSARRVARVTRPPTTNSKLTYGFPLRSTATSLSSGGNGVNTTNKSEGSLSTVSPGQSANNVSPGQPANNSSSAGHPPNRNVRHLTPEEANEYRAKGLCYRCGERYGPLHKCAKKHLNVMILGDDDEGHVYNELNLEDFEPSFEVQP